MLDLSSFIVHAPDVQSCVGGVGVPLCLWAGYVDSLDGLRQSFPHELTFGIDFAQRPFLNMISCRIQPNSFIFFDVGPPY